jgi:hypothetical protein
MPEILSSPESFVPVESLPRRMKTSRPARHAYRSPGQGSVQTECTWDRLGRLAALAAYGGLHDHLFDRGEDA